MSGNDHPVIVHLVNSLQGGGTERTLVALLRAFDPSSFRHVVVTLRGAGLLAERLPDHVASQVLGTAGRSWSTGLRLAALTRRWKATVIHARNTSTWQDAAVAALLNPRARLVLGFHGQERPGPLSVRHTRLARWAVLGGAHFISVSEAGRRLLIDQARIPAERIDLLRNGVDCRAFECVGNCTTRNARRAELGLDESAFVVGTVGSLTPVKQQAMLVRAVAHAARFVPKMRLLIVGDGPLRAALAQQATGEGIGDRVHLLGRRDDVPLLLGCMDVYVCSSAAEGMSNALLEAMAAGLPIVATDVGDNAVVVRDNVDGCIVQANSEGPIADALAMLAGSPEVRHRLGTATRDRAKNYSFERTVRAYEDYYQSLVTLKTSANTAMSHPRTCHRVTVS